MNTNRNERAIEITYTDTENINTLAILEAIYEAAGLLYASKPSADIAVA